MSPAQTKNGNERQRNENPNECNAKQTNGRTERNRTNSWLKVQIDARRRRCANSKKEFKKQRQNQRR